MCSKMNIPMRGDNNETGNIILCKSYTSKFREIVKLRMKGCEIETKHVLDMPKNATYLSPSIISEFINIAACIVREKVFYHARNATYFGISADESTDNCGTQQMALCVRFVNNKNEIEEIFLGFIKILNCTAITISKTILNSLSKYGFDLNKIRGQCYDGANNMSEIRAGVQRLILNKYPQAKYVYCSNHNLNNILQRSCKNIHISNMLYNVKVVVSFFRHSPKQYSKFKNNIPKNVKKKRLINLCHTRWTEQSNCLKSFVELYYYIIITLQQITNDNREQHIIKSKSHNLLLNITRFPFLFALTIGNQLFGELKYLAAYLQTKNLNVTNAFIHIKNLIKTLTNYECKFDQIWNDVLISAKKNDIIPCLPTRIQIRKYKMVKDYFKSIYLKIVNDLKNNLKFRFNNFLEDNVILYGLMNDNKLSISYLELIKLIKTYPDLDCDCIDLKNEMIRWFEFKKNKKQISWCDINKKMFPNLYKIYQAAGVRYISNATCERSFSIMRRIRTFMRSSLKQEKINDLSILNAYKVVVIKSKDVLDRFNKKKKKKSYILIFLFTYYLILFKKKIIKFIFLI